MQPLKKKISKSKKYIKIKKIELPSLKKGESKRNKTYRNTKLYI